MRGHLSHVLVLITLIGMMSLVPVSKAHADVGSTIVERFWDSAVHLIQTRMQTSTPTIVALLQEAEKIYLGDTEDITAMAAIRDAYKAMRVAGLLLLAFCTVISLAGLTETSLMGYNSDFTEWLRRFCVATFMTLGGIHFYGLWIRIFNVMLSGFRQYLDSHWTGPSDPSTLITQLVQTLSDTNVLLLAILVVITLVVLIVLWFLIGGVRMAEMALAVIIAPLVWPLYLLPTLEDIPKTAFRIFLGINGLLLIIVAMLRLAVRMMPGGGVANTLWNFIPAISMLMMTIFLPTMIKRLIGQGNAGVSALSTAGYALAGLKGLSVLATGGSGAAAAVPPAATKAPAAPSGPSAYPLASLPSSSPMTASKGGGSAGAQQEQVWARAPRQMNAGQMAGRPALEAPWSPSASSDVTINMSQSKPGSNEWDTVASIEAFEAGRRRFFDMKGPDSDKE